MYGLLGFVALALMAVGILAIVMGGFHPLRISSRRAGVGVLVGGFAVLYVTGLTMQASGNAGQSPRPVATVLAAQDRAASTIHFGADPQLSTSANLEDVTATVAITNADTVAHTFDPQANFYRVPLAQVDQGDPANDTVTAGYTTLALAPGETRLVAIHAKNFNHDPIASVGFTVTGMR